MPNCLICGNDFKSPRGTENKENQFLTTDPDTDKSLYMCKDCYLTRSESEYRIHEGEHLCNTAKCARNAMAFSKFCEICEEHKKYE